MQHMLILQSVNAKEEYPIFWGRMCKHLFRKKALHLQFMFGRLPNENPPLARVPYYLS